MRERDRYEHEKGRLIREMKRIRDEDGSRFNNFQILNHRYALLNLLGKGGFSEVYKVRAFSKYDDADDNNNNDNLAATVQGFELLKPESRQFLRLYWLL